MTASITWRISDTEWSEETGAITVAHWRVTAIDGDFAADSYGSVALAGDPEAEGFIPIEQVTEQDVIGWVKAALDDADELEAGLLRNIDKQRTPDTVVGLPWAQPAEA